MYFVRGMDITEARHDTYSWFSFRPEMPSCFIWKPLNRASSDDNIRVVSNVLNEQDELHLALNTTRPTP